MTQNTALSTYATEKIDSAIETLRWVRQHIEERQATERLRELDIILSALALSLDHEMNGESDKAREARRRISPATISDYISRAEIEGC